MYVNLSDCLVKSPPLIVPHFNDSETFILYIASSQCMELCFRTAAFDIFFSERCTELFTETKVVKATHCFKQSNAIGTKPINTEAVNFLLSNCRLEALIFTIRSCSLKIGRNQVFKATCLVLLRCESTGSESISQRLLRTVGMA